jgi:hypothetical protein
MAFLPKTPWGLVGLLAELLGPACWAAGEREEREAGLAAQTREEGFFSLFLYLFSNKIVCCFEFPLKIQTFLTFSKLMWTS